MALFAAALVLSSLADVCHAVWTPPSDGPQALDAVETTLRKIESVKLASEQKGIVHEVEKIVLQVKTNQSLTKVQRSNMVKTAILDLQSLEQAFVNSSAAGKVRMLKAELAEKKLELKKDEAELKLAKLQKEALEDQALMKKLMAEKDQVKSAEKEQEEEAAQQTMVSKLVGMAKALVAAKKPKVENTVKLGAVGKDSNATINGILTDLRARASKVTDMLAKMKEAEDKREAEWKDKKEQSKVMQSMHKKMSRSYRQMRAMKMSELKELNEAIGSVQRGDVSALRKVLTQMQSEVATMQAKSKGFLY